MGMRLMYELLVWLVVFVLIACLFLPRRWMHLIGVLGCSIMAHKSLSAEGFQLFAINVGIALVHGVQCWRYWIGRVPPT